MAEASHLGFRPELFDAECIAPATRAFNDQLEQLLATVPSILQRPAAVIREARASGKSALGPIVKSSRAQDRTIETSAGPLVLRVFPNAAARGVLLHLHGGGWSLGAHDQQDVLLEHLADSTGLIVVSVDYRLAPEHRYPAGPDDCEWAALWLAQHAQREFGTDRLFIGGESAGAHLSAVTLLRLRDRHRLRPFLGAVLNYGAYDLRITPSARRWGPRNLVLSTPIIEKFLDGFVPSALRTDPDVSPLYADLQELPPALFTVGTLDPLLDDTLFMASRWAAAGNAADLAIYPGGVHAFNLFPIGLADSANQRIVRFLQGRIAESTVPLR